MLDLDETVLDIYIGPHTARRNRSRMGKASPCMGPAHGQAMHPCGAVALQIKDAAPNENSRDVLSKNLGSALSC